MSSVMSGVFISYRRDDSAGSTGRLFDFLVAAFPGDTVFIDIDGIDAGLDFVEALNDRLSSCEVLLAVIGKHWLAAAPDGTRRIDQPGDYVRLEIETALRRNIRVIPLLVDGAQMPPKEALPDSLESLTRRNALEISHARFSTDARRLVDVLTPLLSASRRPAPRRASGKAKWGLAAGVAALAVAVPLGYLLATRATTSPTVVAARAPVVAERHDAHPADVAKKAPQEPKPPEAKPQEPKPAQTKPADHADAPGAGQPAVTAEPKRAEAAAPPPAQTAARATAEQTKPPQPIDEMRPRWAPAPGSRPFLNVLDASGLDTDKARIRIAAGPNRSVTRKAWCERRTVYAEFGNFSMIDWQDRPAGSGQTCLVRTRWKNHRTDDIVTAEDSPWPRLLNESLKAMCPETYAQTMRDCAVD